MTIYVYGCITCGKTARLLRKFTQYANDNELEYVMYPTRYNEERRQEHIDYLEKAGLPTSLYTAIVVDGDNVRRLSEWSSY